MSTTTHNHAPQPDRQYTAPGFDSPDTQPIPTSPDAGTPSPDADPAQQAPTPNADPAVQGVFGDIDPRLFTLRDFDQTSVNTIKDGLGRVMDTNAPLMTSLKDIHDSMLWSAFSNPPRYALPVIELGRAELALAVQQQFDISDGDDPIGKARAVHTYLNDSAESATDDEKINLTKMSEKVGKYLERADSDDEQAKIADLRENAVAGYYNNAKSHYPRPTLDDAAARKKVDELKNILDEDVEALAYINAIVSHVDVLTPANRIDLAPLQAQLAEARTKLAEQHAERSKKLVDRNADSKEFGKIEQAYKLAIQALIAAELKNLADVSPDGEEFSYSKQMALLTAKHGNELQQEIVDHYREDNSKKYTVINFLACRDTKTGERLKGRAKWIRMGILTAGGVASALTAVFAPVAAAGVAATVASAKFYSTFDANNRDKYLAKSIGLIDHDAAKSSLSDVEFDVDDEKYWFNPVTRKSELVTEDNYFTAMLERTASLITHAAERETKEQTRRRKMRALGAVAIGAGGAFGARFGLHYAMDFFDGTDAAQAASGGLGGDPTPPTPEQKAPSGSWFGDVQPGSPDVPAPEGSGSIPPLLDEVPTGGSPDALPSLGDLPTMELPDGTTVEVPAEYATTEAYTGPGRVFVPSGGGYFDVFKQMGIPESQWNTVLNRVGPALIEHGDAMRLPSDLGSYGVGRPGYVSKFTIDAIKYAATL